MGIFCLILDEDISPEIAIAKRSGEDFKARCKLRNRHKYTIDEYEFGYIAYTQKNYDDLRGHKNFDRHPVPKTEPFDCDPVPGSRNLDVFFGRGNCGELLVRERSCFCSSCSEIITNNGFKIYHDDVLVECKYKAIAGEWTEKNIAKKAERGRDSNNGQSTYLIRTKLRLVLG